MARPSKPRPDEPGFDCTGTKFDCADAYLCSQPDECDPGGFKCRKSYDVERVAPGRTRASATRRPAGPPLDPALQAPARRLSRTVGAAARRGKPTAGQGCGKQDFWCGGKYETVCREVDCRPGKFKCHMAFRCEEGFTG
jgi:hypothetical protein